MTKQHIRNGLLTTALLACFSADLVNAAPVHPIQLHLSVERKTTEADAQGKSRAVWATLAQGKSDVHPGDILRYRVDAQNVGASPISGLVVTQSVPPGTVYVARSADGTAVGAASGDYSLDGRQFSPQPMQTVTGSDGTARTRPALPDTYAALRWRFPALPPHASEDVTYLVKVR